MTSSSQTLIARWLPDWSTNRQLNRPSFLKVARQDLDATVKAKADALVGKARGASETTTEQAFGELAKGQQHAMRLLGDRRNHPLACRITTMIPTKCRDSKGQGLGQGQIPTAIPTKCRDWYLFDWYRRENSGDSCA